MVSLAPRVGYKWEYYGSDVASDTGEAAGRLTHGSTRVWDHVSLSAFPSFLSFFLSFPSSSLLSEVELKISTLLEVLKVNFID